MRISYLRKNAAVFYYQFAYVLIDFFYRRYTWNEFAFLFSFNLRLFLLIF